MKERGLKAPTTETCEKFLTVLYKYRVSATLRRTIGDDVEGACGQLRFKAMNERNNEKKSEKIKEVKKIVKDDKRVPKEKSSKTTRKVGNTSKLSKPIKKTSTKGKSRKSF